MSGVCFCTDQMISTSCMQFSYSVQLCVSCGAFAFWLLIVIYFNCDGDNAVDLIPVDYVANLLIIAGARNRSVDDVKIYNSCSSAVNLLKFRRLLNYVENDTVNLKNKGTIYPKVFYIVSRWLMIIIPFLLESIPAYFADWLSFVCGKKPINLKILAKSRIVRRSIHSFIRRTWMIKSEHVCSLQQSVIE